MQVNAKHNREQRWRWNPMIFFSLKDRFFFLLQLNRLRSINSGTDGEHLLLFGNIRPSMPVNNRLLRTNISYRPRVSIFSQRL